MFKRIAPKEGAKQFLLRNLSPGFFGSSHLEKFEVGSFDRTVFRRLKGVKKKMSETALRRSKT